MLFEGLPDGAAYVLKIHHALADPLGTVQLLSMLQSCKRGHTARKPLADEVAAVGAGGEENLIAEGFPCAWLATEGAQDVEGVDVA